MISQAARRHPLGDYPRLPTPRRSHNHQVFELTVKDALARFDHRADVPPVEVRTRIHLSKVICKAYRIGLALEYSPGHLSGVLGQPSPMLGGKVNQIPSFSSAMSTSASSMSSLRSGLTLTISVNISWSPTRSTSSLTDG